MRVRVLRPVEEPLGHVVRDVDLRQPDEEPRVLPAPAGYVKPALLFARARGRAAVLRRDEHRRAQHGPGGRLRDDGAGAEHRGRASRGCWTSGTWRSSRSAAHVAAYFGSGFWANAHFSILSEGPVADMAGIHLNFLLILVLAIVATTIAGVLIGVPTLRLAATTWRRHARVRRDHRADRGQRPRDPVPRRVADGRAERHSGDRPGRPAVHRALRRAEPAPVVLVRAGAGRAHAAGQLPAARLAPRPRVGGAARGRAGGGLRGHPDRAHEAARLRRGRGDGRRVRRVPRVLHERREPDAVHVRVLDLHPGDGRASAGWARSGASSPARSCCRCSTTTCCRTSTSPRVASGIYGLLLVLVVLLRPAGCSTPGANEHRCPRRARRRRRWR